jgi:hypothetical protein
VARHADVKACAKCSRPFWLYGSIDLETNWRGWCSICNIRWKRARLVRIVQSVSRSYRQMVYAVSDYIVAFLVASPRSQHERAMRTVWRVILLGKTKKIKVWDGRESQRVACTEDELSDCIFNPDLVYVNPLWKLCVARRRYSGFPVGRPMHVLVTMLGSPYEMLRKT